MKALPLTTGAALAAALTVALGAATGVATGASGATAAPSAADPITGTYVFTVGFDRSPRTHTITAAADGFTITAMQGFRTAGSLTPGTPFWVLDRTGLDQADTDPANCTVPAGAVIAAQLRYTSTDTSGGRHYTGVGLKAVGAVASPHPCSLAGLQPPFYAVLGRHGDTADKDGPYNFICWGDDSPTATGCSTAFTRLAGTGSPGVVTTTGTTTAAPPAAKPPTAAQPVRGLVPKSPKAYLDKRFKDDRTAPVVKALASTGRRGAPFFLLYRSTDDRGFAGETYAIFKGTKLVKQWSVMAGERDGRVQRAPSSLPPSVSGKLTFCVGAQDMNGNRSAWSCAPLTIR